MSSRLPVNSQELSINVIIMAAGASKRLGVPKQLLPWKGRTLLNHTIEQFLALGLDPFVIIGAYSDSILPSIELPESQILINDKYQEGISSSIRMAIDSIGGHSDSILFTLADLPLIKAQFYKQLIFKYANNNNKVVATSALGKTMVPAIFPRHTYELLMQVRGDRGAGELLNSHEANIRTVYAGGLWLDVDTREDYRKLLEREGDD